MSNRPGRRRFVLILGIGGALLAALAASFFLLRNSNASPRPDPLGAPSSSDALPVPVEVTEARQGVISSSISSSSTLEAEQAAQVLAKIDGLVTSVLVREGETVKTGQILATLEEEEKRLALEKARLRLGKAQAEYERAKLSHEQKLLSKHDFEKALFDRDLAAAELKTAELELQYTRVLAPFSGRITEKAVVQGKTVKKSDHLFTLADFNTLVARLFLPEKDVFSLKPNQPVELALESLAGSKFQGRIRDISPVVDPKTGTVKVTVKVADSSTDARPGAFVRVNIITGTHAQAVLVPKLAVVREDGEDFVFLAASGVSVKRKVRLGYASNGAVEVTEGVRPGDLVVVAGQASLKDQSRLEILK